MKIALVSFNQVWEDKEANLLLCKNYLKEAVNNDVDLIVFPEMTLTGFSTNIEKIAEDINSSNTIKNFQSLSKQYGIAIHFGVVVSDEDKALNKSCFIDNHGELISEYSKIHPFSFADEDKFYNHGNALSIVDFKGYKIGLSICYDLRFPELYSALAQESDIIINIANWPKKRVDHWNTLLKARAIENQTFIIGVNRTGIDGNGLEYEESSNIFNANGEQLNSEKINEMKIFKIDKNWTQLFKNNFSTFKDRNTELYKEII